MAYRTVMGAAENGRPGVPRLALRPAEAAEALGLSRDSFDRYVAPEVRWTRRGRLKLVAVSELENWLSRSSARTLESH